MTRITTQNMLKILYIVTQPEFGGAQRYVFDLARRLSGQTTNLSKSQHEVHIAAGGLDGPLFERARSQNLAVHTLKHLVRPISPIHDILAYFELKKLIAGLKPDIVHLNSSKAGVLGSMAARALRAPKIIYTAHGFVFNEPMNPIKKWLYTKAELETAKRVDAVIAVSEFDRNSGIKAGIDANKIITIHNGIDPTQMHFFSREEARMSLRGATRTRGATRQFPTAIASGQAYQRTEARLRSNVPQRDVRIAAVAGTLPRNDKLIGCIANFYPTKGLDILIHAMTSVDARLVIIGDGELRPLLEAQIKKLNLSDRVNLIGQLPDAYQYLKGFDLFVLPSRKEGFPYVLLEAAAAGVPIVATKVGGIPEIITDGATGYLAEPNNPENLAQKISQALQKPLSPQLPDACALASMVQKTVQTYAF